MTSTAPLPQEVINYNPHVPREDEPMGWYLKLGMGSAPVVDHDPPLERNLTLPELRAQPWPPCPVCGTPVRVEINPSPGGLDAGPTVYIAEDASCPRGHDLVAALQERD